MVQARPRLPRVCARRSRRYSRSVAAIAAARASSSRGNARSACRSGLPRANPKAGLREPNRDHFISTAARRGKRGGRSWLIPVLWPF